MERWVGEIKYAGVELNRTYGSKDVLGQCVYGHLFWRGRVAERSGEQDTDSCKLLELIWRIGQGAQIFRKMIGRVHMDIAVVVKKSGCVHGNGPCGGAFLK
jgi:hypothetical protein